jgi:molecular chaperone Hsp33
MTHARLTRTLAAGGAARVLALDMTAVAEQQRLAHELSADAAWLGAEGAVATCLMSAHIKGDERITLQARLSRPQAMFIGEVDAEGHYRGRCSPTDLVTVSRSHTGVWAATKHNADRELYSGHTQVTDGRVVEALRAHLGDSDQVDSDGQASLSAAQFVDRFAAVEKHNAREILEGLDGFELLGQPVELLRDTPVRWQCRCSLAKVENTLIAMGADELESLHEEQGQASVTCQFCNHTYVVDATRLAQLVDLLRGVN